MVSSVLIVDRCTCRAPLAGGFGADEQHGDAGTSDLARDECLQLPERAVTKPSALRTAGLDPFANALEVFKAAAATGALRRQHDRLQWFSCLWNLRCFPESWRRQPMAPDILKVRKNSKGLLSSVAWGDFYSRGFP